MKNHLTFRKTSAMICGLLALALMGSQIHHGPWPESNPAALLGYWIGTTFALPAALLGYVIAALFDVHIRAGWLVAGAFLFWFLPVARLRRMAGVYDAFAQAGKRSFLSGCAAVLDTVNRLRLGRGRRGGWA